MDALPEEKVESRIAALGIFKGALDIAPLSGGITNRNYLVKDAVSRYVVRLGEDIPVHLISRANELAASQAAHAAGISPAVLHHAPGILVLDFIDARPLSPEEVRRPENLERIVPLVRQCHRDVPKYLRGTATIFWVFHVIRDYAASLRAASSPHAARLGDLLENAGRLESAAGPFDIVFGHNDLLAANILDDGDRLWLIDWDYAGFNAPLFDLGGLASNNELSHAAEIAMLENYYATPLNPKLWRQYQAMKCASLLREAMWSMVSEIHSTIVFDYSGYTAENLARFKRAYDNFIQM